MRYLFLFLLSAFGVCASGQDITISEINYKSHITRDCDDWVELYNFGTTPINLLGWTLKDTSTASVPFTFGNRVINPGARMVVMRKKAQFASVYSNIISTIDTAGPFSFKINGTDIVELKNAAGNLVVAAKIAGTYGWPNGSDGEGRTNELVVQNQKTSLLSPSDWRDGCMGGSPGTAPQPCVDPIIFTEINYNSNDTFDQGEWVELYNNTTTNFDLTGYFLRDAFDTIGFSSVNTYFFPVGTVIAPGGYLVITNDTFRTRHYHPTVPANKILGNFNYNLGNQGELLKLFDNNLRLSFSLHYNDTIPWPLLADGKGYTLELKQKNGLYNDGTNWETGCKLGSPGGPKTSPCQPVYPFNLDPLEIAPSLSIYPNPTARNIYIESEQLIEKVNIYDITGRCINQMILNQKHGMITELQPGIYQAQVVYNNNRVRYQKIIVE